MVSTTSMRIHNECRKEGDTLAARSLTIPIMIVVTVVIVLIITAFPSLNPRVWYTKPMLVLNTLQPTPRSPKKTFWTTMSPMTKPLRVVVALREKKHPAKNPHVGAKIFDWRAASCGGQLVGWSCEAEVPPCAHPRPREREDVPCSPSPCPAP